MTIDEVALKLQETTDRSVRNEGRIKKLEGEHTVLQSLATSVAVMAEQIKTMNGSISRLTGEVEEIKEKPGKRWESIAEKALTVIVGAVVGYVLAQIGLG